MKSYPRDEHHKPGSWKPLYCSRAFSGGLRKFISATFCCPVCGLFGTLEDHQINDNGEVSPSVDCPSEACTFHEMIRLEGWPAR